MKNLIFAICLSLAGFGCTTVHISRSFPKINELSPIQPAASIVVENYGYYLFGFVPIICGDTSNPNSTSCDWFTDTVTIDNNVKLVKREADKFGSEVILGDLKTETKSSGSFSAWIFWRKIITTSACIYRIDKNRADLKELRMKNAGMTDAPSATPEILK